MDIKQIKDDQQYKVRLTEKIEVAGQILYPGPHEIILRGDVLKLVAESIAHAEPV